MSKLDDYLNSIGGGTKPIKKTGSKLDSYLNEIGGGIVESQVDVPETPIEINPYQDTGVDEMAQSILNQKKKDKIQAQLDSVKNQNASIGMPTATKKESVGNKISNFVSNLFGFGMNYDDGSVADTIKMQEKARWENRKEEINNALTLDTEYQPKKYGSPSKTETDIKNNFVAGWESGLLGAFSTWKTAESLVLKKLGADEKAKKKEQEGIDLRNTKKIYDAEYRSGAMNQDYSLKEKLGSAPVKYLVGQIAESLPISLGSLVVGAGAGYAGAGVFSATVLSTATMSLFSYGSAYQDAREYGLGEEEATNIAGKIALTTAPLEALPEFRLFSKIAGNTATNTVRKSFIKNLTNNAIDYSKSFAEQGVLEMATEIPQTVIENAWKQTYNENQDLFEGVAEAGLTAFFSGGITDVLVGASSDLYNTVKNSTRKDVSETKAKMLMSNGMSEEQAVYELSKEIGAIDAQEVVASAVAEMAQETPLPELKETPVEKIQSETPKPFKLDESYLDKTPTEFKDEISNNLNNIDTSVKDLADKVAKLEEDVKNAPAKSQEKKSAKINLAKAKTQLSNAKADAESNISSEVSKIRDIVESNIKETGGLENLTKEEMQTLVDTVIDYTTDPVQSEAFADTPINEIIKGVVKEYAQNRPEQKKKEPTVVKAKKETVTKAKPKLKETTTTRDTAKDLIRSDVLAGSTLKQIMNGQAGRTSPDGASVQVGGYLNGKKIGSDKIVVTRDENGNEVNEIFSIKELMSEIKSENAPKTQKEIVKESIKDKAKSIKEIAKETGIVEPNIRRILGVGAKEGTFERIDNGVYVLSKNGIDMAWIEAGNSLEVLPRLISEGKKFDMIYSDLPYESGGNIGGNRPLGYVAITPEIYKNQVIPNFVKLSRDENTPIIHIMTTGKSSVKQAKQYNDAIINNPDLKLVAVGSYVKLRPNGQVSNMGKYPMPPEAVMIFNQSGVLPENLPKSFEVRALDPKYTKNNYKTQKAVELVDKLIEYTTDTGGNILDPFAGSGLMTARAVSKGRKSTAIEIDKNVVENVIKPKVKEAVDNLVDNKLDTIKPQEVETKIVTPQYILDIQDKIIDLKFDPDTGTYAHEILSELSSSLKDMNFNDFKQVVQLIRNSEVNNFIKEELTNIVKKYQTTIDNLQLKDNTISNETTNNNLRGNADGKRLSDSSGLGEKGQGGTGEENKGGSKTKRETRDTTSDVGTGLGGAKVINGVTLEKGKKYTNAEIESVISGITSIDNGQVNITDKSLITDEVLEALNQYKVGGDTKEGRGILDEYFTSSKIVDVVSQILNIKKNVKVLEPSVGSGNFVYAIPEAFRGKVNGYEINPITAGMAKIFHPDMNVRTDAFESLFMDEKGNKKDFVADYDLVIGNPPYGAHRGLYKGLGEEAGIDRYETYFIKRGLDSLKEGGTLAMVVPSGFIRSGMGKGGKAEIAKIAHLVEAWRLPNGSFDNTEVGTDIVVFKKGAGKFPTSNLEFISNDYYFKNYPNNVLGTTTKKQTRYGLDPYVEGTLDEAIDMFNTRRTEMLAKNMLENNNIEVTDESMADAENAVEDSSGKVDESVTVEQVKKDVKKEQRAKKVIEQIKKDTKNTKTSSAEMVSIAKQLSDISQEELAIWEKTNRDGYVDNPTESEKKTLNYMGGKYYNDFNYAQGDIYEKIDILNAEKDSVPDYESQRAKLLAVLPTPESVATIKISPNHTFTEKVNLSNGESIKSNFKQWIRNLPRDVFGSSSAWEVREYVDNVQVRGNDKKYNDKIRDRRKVKAEELFKKFMNEISDVDQNIIEDSYNKQYNSYYKPDFTKVPQFQKINKTFKGKAFSLRESQKESLGMIANRGSALVALDVGNGKTLVGVLATTEAMERGYTKRPLWVVPNPSIASQWIKTAKDVSPNVKINNLGNLGAKFNVGLDKLEIKDGEITIITKEGLQALEFSDETYDELAGKFAYISDDLNAHKTKRQQEQAKAENQTTKGKMKRGTRSDLSFEKLGFDYFVYDEVHQANHIVSKVKMDKGKATDFRAGQPSSNIGLKTWLASQYIQSKNDGKNVVLLSATPFTNNPLEYYSIISLIGNKYLEKIGAQNVNDFFNMFMEASTDYEVKANGNIEKKSDIRGMKNFRQWKNLLNQFSVFASQPKDIIVPDKHNESYYIPQNAMQMDFNNQAQELFKDKVAGSLLGVGEMKKIAFSPYISRYYTGTLLKSDYKMFVDGSPKIKTTMELIRQNLKDRPEAGQIIYTADTGKDTSPLMQEYLIKEIGLKPEEVGIINGDTPQAKRLSMQDDYNNGKIKVIIGSDAIQVGMELQMNSTDLYIIGMPWNFTSLRQVTGRIHRQNNKWKNVRINIMMSENSADVFQMQKIQNKQDRYEASLKQDAQELDLGDIDSEEMKADLMTDPEKKAKFIIEQKYELLRDKKAGAESEKAFALRKFEKITKLQKEVDSFKDSLEYEKKQNLRRIEEGKEPDNYWIETYTKKLATAEQNLAEMRAEFEAKGLSMKELDTITKRTTEEVEKIEKEMKELTLGEKDLIEKIKSEMPQLKEFSNDDVKAFVAKRAEQNKTFYELRKEPENTDVVLEKKEIKNASGTKTIKTKTVATVKPTVKPSTKAVKSDPMSVILADKKLTVKEKVTKLLDKKQAGKDFKDAGERVAGSKKENAVIKAVLENGNVDIINELINELGIEAVSALYDKDTILENTPKPDIEADKKAKVPAHVAGAKQTIFRLINKKPNLEAKKSRGYWRSQPYGYYENGLNGSYTSYGREANIGATKLYPEVMKAFVSDLSAVKTYEDISELRNKKYYFTPEGKQITPTEDDKIFFKFDTDIFGKTIDKAFKDVINEQSTINSYEYKIDRVKEMTSESIADYHGGTYGLRSPEEVSPYNYQKSYDTPQEAQDSLKYKDGVIKALTKQKKDLLENYDAFMPKKAVRSESVNLDHGNFEAIEIYDVDEKRVPDARVNNETLMKNLGFKSVQLGNYVEDDSAKEHIRQTIGAMEDMSKMLGVDFALINKNKGLSIAFGARGGGRFLAHYEPTNNIINITKKRGDGSFGHEYAHFLDWTMGKRGKLSGQYFKGMRRYYREMKPAIDLMQAILEGKGIKSDKTFKPEAEFDTELYYNERILQFRKDGNSIEEAIKQFGDSEEKLQSIANVYREEVSGKVQINTKEFGWTSEFYAKSKKAGGNNSYWTQKHELFARAFQAYLEDKMIENGIENNYLTRPTKDLDVYPQGVEREAFNKLFDKVFNEMKYEYPYKETQQPRFKTSDTKLVLTKGGEYLSDVKKRLNIDFDTFFADTILYNGDEAMGAMYDMSILLSSFDEMTKAHETMHLLLASAYKIPVFKRAGITRKVILEEKARQMGVKLDSKNFIDIEEAVATDFENYLAKKYAPKGIIARFFELLRTQFAKLKKAIGLTEGNVIREFFDIIDEGTAKEDEYVRLENNGVIASLLDDSGIVDMSNITDFAPRFKMKDSRLQNISEQLGNIENKYQEYENKLALWKQSLQDEIAFQMSAKEIIDGTSKEIKDLARYTYRTTNKNHKIGELTPAGKALANSITDPNLSQEITAYLKAKIELKDARKRASAIRKDLKQFKGEKKATIQEVKVFKRKLKTRQNQVKFIEQGFDYSARRVVPKVIKDATKYGKKAKLQEIKNRQAEIIAKLKELPLSVRGKVAVLNSIRNATTPVQYANVIKKIDTRISEYQKARTVMKDLSQMRSKIGFIKHVGEMDNALITDVKEQLGIEKSLTAMNTEELGRFTAELVKRLEFKQKTKFTSAPMTPAEYQAIAEKRASKTRMDVIKENLPKNTQDVLLSLDKITGTTSTRLYSIAPELSRVVRSWAIKVTENIVSDEKAVRPFLLGLKKLKETNKVDFEKLDLALKNRNTALIEEITTKHGMDITEVRRVIADIYKRIGETNIDMGYLENYFPRQIKHGMKDDFIQAKIKLVENKLGRKLTDAERIDITNNAILGFGKNKYILTTTGNMKERIVDEVDESLAHFYEDSISALVNYIGSINNNIETRKFFGKYNKNTDFQSDIDNKYKDTIGAYVLDLVREEKITPAQVQEVTDILSALFTHRNMSAFAQGITNLSYLATMGQMVSFIPQIQDLSFSLYKNGLWGTVRSIPLALSRDAITPEDLNLNDSLRNEVGSNGLLSRHLNFVMSTNGIKFVDQIALKVFINGRFTAYKEMAQSGTLSKSFTKKLNDVFGSDYQKVLQDLKKGELSTEVKRLIIDDVLDIRPEGSTEKSEQYNKGSASKMLYTLKQYTLKQMDIYRKEVYLNIRNGIQTNDNAMVLNGLKNFALLTTYLVLMGMGGDELKDWILGRKTTLSDKVMNNMFKLIGISQFTLDTASRDGIGKAFVNTVLPVQATVPFDVAQGIYTDFIMLATGELKLNNSKLLKYIPYIGRITYNRFGSGADYNKKTAQATDKADLLQEAIDNDIDEDTYIESVERAKMENQGKELSPQAIGQLRREYSIRLEYGFNDQYANDLESAKDNDEKVDILKDIELDLGEEFNDWLETAVDTGLVSDALYNKYYQLD